MAFIPVPNTASVEMIYATLGGSKIENVFHVEKADPFNAAQLVDLADIFDDWDTAHVNLRAASCLLNLIVCKALDSSTAPGIEHPITPGRGGTRVSPQLPNNVSLTMKWGTGLRGRSFRGRTYLVGMTEDMTIGDEISPELGAILEAAYGQLVIDIADHGWNLVVVSRYHGVDPITKKPIPRASGITTPITNVTTDRVVDSQRRRLQGRGQ